MLLQTQIPFKKQPENQIDYHSKLFLIGSCFSENIGNRLSYYKFQTNINPFGVLFHPKAIEKLILKILNKEPFTEKDVFFFNEHWHSFDVHSSLSNPHKETLLYNLNTILTEAYQQLKTTTHFIITLGTSWVYKHTTSDKIVANCHKISQKEFSKELLSVDQISESLQTIFTSLKNINADISVIFTTSPVRHLKDGFIENMRSKSHLISGIHNFLTSTSTNQTNNCFYFPSYEIMMDELRDYRFYKEDMIHPNKTAINYIWEKFNTSWVSEQAQKTLEKVETIQKGLAHKPFNPNSEAHLKFLENLEQKKETLLKAFPFMNF